MQMYAKLMWHVYYIDNDCDDEHGYGDGFQ